MAAGDPYCVLHLLEKGLVSTEEANATMQCVSDVEGSLALVGYSCRTLSKTIGTSIK